MQIRWTRPALRQLTEAAEYIAERNEAAPGVLVARVRRSVEALARTPGMGRPGRVPGTRELIVPSTAYVVPYRVRDEAVEILAVLHGARLWPDSF